MAKFNKIKINRVYPTLFLSLLLSFSLPGKAKAEVFINGQHFQGQDLALLEYILGPISPGRYWLNTDTGNWGYEGNSTVQGNVLTQNINTQTSHPYIRKNGDIYDPSYGGSSATTDSNGCTYFSIPGMSINSCDPNW